MKDILQSHLNFLVEEIGARPAGTVAHHRVEKYVRNSFERAGLLTTDISVSFPDWRPVEATLTLNGKSFPADINPFSPPCNVTAPLISISTLPELEAADLNGRIVLLYGELSKAPIFPINFAAIQFERDQSINRLLIAKSPEAIIAVNLHPWRKMHIFEDEDFPIPSVTVAADVGRELLYHTGKGAHLHINTQSQASQATTIIGQKAQHRQRIVLCAHYDTKYDTPGACDNGTGMAILLTLAELFSKQCFSVGLEFVAWADEEYGAHTDTQYVQRMGDSFDDILCVINMDGIGLITENTTVTALAHGDEFERAIRQVLTRYPGIVWVDPWIQSNHATFAMRGVPAIAMSSLTWERTHQADDSLAWISVDKLEESVRFITEVIAAIQTFPSAWSRA